MLESVESEHPKLKFEREIFSKNSNLRDHGTPGTTTSRTDRQRDRQTTCRSSTSLCLASCGKNWVNFVAHYYLVILVFVQDRKFSQLLKLDVCDRPT